MADRNDRGPALTRAERAFAESRVVFEDPALIAFDKPAGLAVQGGSGVDRSLDDLLWTFARSKGRPPRLVHRLDRETSGVIVAARTKPAAAALSAAFAERRMEKTYLAIVCGGAPEPSEGVIDIALRKATRRGLDVMERAPPGAAVAQNAVTRYQTLGAGSGFAVLRLEPETGRMHQLRVHLSLIGRPIFGDGKYGGLLAWSGGAAPGLMLHAWSLEGPHPDGGRFAVTAPPPQSFLDMAAAIGAPLTAEAL
jgi:tRNA pseudouridine32 synthase/23S rRNA pseudouridine746 synthase